MEWRAEGEAAAFGQVHMVIGGKTHTAQQGQSLVLYYYECRRAHYGIQGERAEPGAERELFGTK